MTSAFRLASPDDVEEITTLINRAFQVERFFKAGDRTDSDHVRALLLEGAILVIEDPPRIIGSAYTKIHDDRVYIGMVSVDPSCQGRGIGRALMTAAEEHGRAHGCTVADINVVNLRTELPPFYRKLGYVETGTKAFDHTETSRPCHLVTMSKRL